MEATVNKASQTGVVLLSDDVALGNIRQCGHALQARNLYNYEPGKTASLAVPVFDASGKLAGALVLIYFASAIKPTEAPGKFLADMQAMVQQIGLSLGQAALG